MLILFDQATPVPIRPYLEGHTVRDIRVGTKPATVTKVFQ
jgi:hypothetical protein